MSGILFTRSPGQLEQSCKYLHWSYLANAVLFVYDENIQVEKTGQDSLGIPRPEVPKANADVWATHSMLRRDLAVRTRVRWCACTGLDATWFPYGEDAVVRMYMRFRKRSDEELNRFRTELEVALP